MIATNPPPRNAPSSFDNTPAAERLQALAVAFAAALLRRTPSPAWLDRSLGPGVRLLGMTLEVTNAAVTHGLARYLPWPRAHRGSLMPLTRDRRRTRSLDERTLAERLHDGDFTRGLTR